MTNLHFKVIATHPLDRSTTHKGDPEPLEMTGFSPRFSSANPPECGRVAEVTRFRENDDFYRNADFLDRLHMSLLFPTP
jgi:hypothetical protein